MDIQFYGANCLVISNKQVRVVVDDNLAALGAKSVTKDGDICLFTGMHEAVQATPKLTIDMPGEYEVSGISIVGLQTRSHMDEVSEKSAITYKITWGDARILITGHIFPELSDEQLEAIGIVDVMFVPVGGNGYTIDAIGAMQLIKSVEPKLIVPTHYNDSRLNFAVPQAEINDVLKVFAMEPKEHVSKLQLKPSDMADATQVVVIDATK